MVVDEDEMFLLKNTSSIVGSKDEEKSERKCSRRRLISLIFSVGNFESIDCLIGSGRALIFSG
jgi:hypothetical protein